VGTLYLVGASTGDPKDVTCRALRVLRAAGLIAAADTNSAQCLLDHLNIDTPLALVAQTDNLLAALVRSDVALLTTGWEISPNKPAQRLVHSALEHGFPVESVPGPAHPITALVISGLPADSFVYLGKLPEPPAECRALLASVVTERRTLVALEAPQNLVEALANLSTKLGNRPLAIAAEGDQGIEIIWRGTLGDVGADEFARKQQEVCVLIVGGATEETSRWTENQLRAEFQARLEQNLGVKEISRQLAAESGWPRREIYRLGVEISQAGPPEERKP